jgi:hypothetical protein
MAMNIADWQRLEGFMVYAAGQVVEIDKDVIVLDSGEAFAINGDARKLRSKPAVVFAQHVNDEFAESLEESLAALKAEGKAGPEDAEFDGLVEDLETRIAAMRANLLNGPYDVAFVMANDQLFQAEFVEADDEGEG